MDRPTLMWPNWIGVVAQDFDDQRRPSRCPGIEDGLHHAAGPGSPGR
jgi:hypothetical protein